LRWKKIWAHKTAEKLHVAFGKGLTVARLLWGVEDGSESQEQ
jgi:hypothetical protein